MTKPFVFQYGNLVAFVTYDIPTNEEFETVITEITVTNRGGSMKIVIPGYDLPSWLGLLTEAEERIKRKEGVEERVG